MSGDCHECGEHTLECRCKSMEKKKIRTAINKKKLPPISPKPQEIYDPGTYHNPELLGPKEEKVDHPKHYQGQKYEVIDIIEDFALGFNLGNSIKYILRAGKKGLYSEDIKKAIWYLQREIDHPS